jgi:16S rRNA (guanine966-N2)-methyltransferase
MRVISGRFRGRRLIGPKGMELRPTADRLKEAMFNILGQGVENSLWLDVFAGSGSVGLEAISRGARQVDFLDQDPSACRLVRKNLEICGILAGYRLFKDDAFHGLRRLAREGTSYDFIFMDPPYAWEPYVDLLQIAFSRGLAAGPAVVIIEHHVKTAMSTEGECYTRTRFMRQGEQALSFYAAQPSTDPK